MITLNNRELKMLKEYMTHHSWSDFLVDYPNQDPTYKKDSSTIKQYGGLRAKFRMSSREIDTFRNKIGI